MAENPARDHILGDGSEPSWWFLRGITKAHMAVDVVGGPSLQRAVVVARCGLRVGGERLERRLLGGHDLTTDACRACAMGLEG
jgi:hypothetical protein